MLCPSINARRDDVSELQDDWFAGIGTVLITAGASAPDDLVQAIIQALVDKYDGEVDESTIVEEDVKFALPVTLRILKREAAGA